MKSILFDGALRRWSLTVGLLAGLAALLVTLAPSIDAQQRPQTPHWFWGNDASAYAGAEIKAFDQNGVEINTGGDGTAIISSNGEWSVTISQEDAIQVRLRIVSPSGDRETALMDVIVGGFDSEGLSIREFNLVAREPVSIRIRARVYPTGEHPDIPHRSIEFNLVVDDEVQPLNDMPRQRTIRPHHASGRWYASNEFEIGGGLTARIIACKRPDDGVRFGVRVDGYGDFIPRRNLMSASRTSTSWAVSDPAVLIPGTQPVDGRAGRGDDNCTFGK